MAKKNAGKPKELKFEDAMAGLEEIVQRLEGGEGSLEEALSDYSKAAELLKDCHAKLEIAQRKVEILSGVDAQGNPITEPMEETVASMEEKRQKRRSRRSAKKSPPEQDGSNELF